MLRRMVRVMKAAKKVRAASRVKEGNLLETAARRILAILMRMVMAWLTGMK